MTYQAKLDGCPHCGGSLEHTNSTGVHTGTTSNGAPHQWARAILRCHGNCRRNWELSVTLAPGPKEPH